MMMDLESGIKFAIVDDRQEYYHQTGLAAYEDKLLNESQCSLFIDQSSLVERFNRFILTFAMRFCSIERFVLDYVQRNPQEWHDTRRRRESSRPSVDLGRTRNKASLFSRLVLLIYLVSVLHISANIYYQYLYDFDQLKLGKLRQISGQGSREDARGPLEAEELRLLARLKRQDIKVEDAIRNLTSKISASRRALRTIGAPDMGMQFVTECLYLLWLVLSFGCFVNPQLYFNFFAKFDYYFAGYIMNFSKEQKNCDLLVRDQMESFIKSSANFANIQIDLSEEMRSDGLGGTTAPTALALAHEMAAATETATATPSPRAASGAADEGGKSGKTSGGDLYFDDIKFEQHLTRDTKLTGLERILLNHSITCEQLHKLYSIGLLHPLNREPSWISNLMRWYSIFNCLCILYVLVFDFFVLLAFRSIRVNQRDLNEQQQHQQPPLQRDAAAVVREPLSYADLAIQADLVVLVTYTNIPCCFYAILLLANCVDQIKLINGVRELIHSCIRSSNKRAHELRLREENIRDFKQLNTDLLMVIMQFKIFMVQLKPLRRSFAILPTSAVFAMFLFPVMGRLHMPYVASDSVDTFKSTIIMMSLHIVAFADCCLLPVAYLNSRCIELYRSMVSLLAHSIELISEPRTGHCYDEHSIWILRKELSDPQKLLGQLGFVLAGLQCNYSNLVRIHFWFSLILVTIIIENQKTTQYGIFNNLLNDPFGVI